jgi:hypothetical protein
VRLLVGRLVSVNNSTRYHFGQLELVAQLVLLYVLREQKQKKKKT